MRKNELQKKDEQKRKEEMDNYKGYALFSDIEDEVLKTRNRAVVMCNIFEDNPDPHGKDYVAQKGALLIFGYMEAVPKGERGSLAREFQKQMLERGYRYV